LPEIDHSYRKKGTKEPTATPVILISKCDKLRGALRKRVPGPLEGEAGPEAGVTSPKRGTSAISPPGGGQIIRKEGSRNMLGSGIFTSRRGAVYVRRRSLAAS